MLETTTRKDIANGIPSRKRPITSNRKEQNRAAAKAYRQRQKEKLQDAQSRSKGVQELRPRPAPSAEEFIPNLHAEIDSENNGNQLKDTQNTPFQGAESSHNPITRCENHGYIEDLNSNEGLPLPAPLSSPNPRGRSISLLNFNTYDLNHAQPPLLGDDSGNLNSSETLDEADSRAIVLSSTLYLPMFNFLDAESAPNVSDQNSSPGREITLQPFPSFTQEDPFHSQNAVSFPLSHILEVDDIPSDQSDLLLTHQCQPQTTIYPSFQSLADPYTNYIPLWRGSAFTATLYIAISINLNMDLIRTSSWASPFYHPTSPSSDPKTLLATARLPYAPANLQPTLPQILFPHHVYIDIIPFPTFRARAITLASTSPPMLDLWDLKMDINEGLVCCNPGNGGNVQPWDVRSWKVAPWFLRKWRMLIN